jgi:AhpD family alkylhydroperoxidase
MARIEGVDASRAGVVVRVAYLLTRRQFGRMLDPITVYAHAPGLLAGYGRFERATAKQHRVEERIKTLAEAKVAALVNCEFCVDISMWLARRSGITEEQLLALAHYRDSDAFEERERLVLDYAVAMTHTPARVSDELFAAMREHFDERQMVELTNVIALENMRARFNCAFDMAPGRFSDGMACARMEGSPAMDRDAAITDASAGSVVRQRP